MVDTRRIQIAIADLRLPLVALPAGPLAQNSAVVTQDGSVRIVLAKTVEELVEKVYLPWAER